MSTDHANRLLVHAIDPDRLDLLRTTGTKIALISYATDEHPSVWREVGPVYIHGRTGAAVLPVRGRR